MTVRSRVARYALPAAALAVATGVAVLVATHCSCGSGSTSPDGAATPTARPVPDDLLDGGAPRAAVRGTVRAAASGEPLVGARVWLAAPADPRDDTLAAEALAETVTGPDGRYLIEGAPVGTAELLALAPGFARGAAWVALAGGETATADLALEPGAALGGVVVDSEGGPLAEVLLLATASAGGGASAPASVPTDAVPPRPWFGRSSSDGRFEVAGLPPGTYELRASREGFLEVSVPDLVPPRSDLRVELDSIGRLSGMVFDGVDGAPMAYARVEIAGSGLWPPREVTADATGYFRALGLPEGVYEVRATAEGADGTARASPVLEGIGLGAGAPAQTLDLAVEPAVLLAGRVVSPAGAPIPGARLLLGLGPLRVLALVAVADAAGEFAFSPLLPDTYSLDVTARGWSDVRALEVIVRGSGGVDTPAGTGPGTETGSGTGDTPDLDPFAGMGADPGAGGAAAGEPAGGARPGAVEAILVTLLPAVRVEGLVVDAADGRALAGAEIEIHGGEEAGGVPFVISREALLLAERLWRARLGEPSAAAAVAPFATDSTGTFSVDGVPAGARVRVRAAASGYAPGWSAPLVAGAVGPAGAVVARVSLVRGVTVSGRIRDEAGMPIERAAVRAEVEADREGAAALTDGAGAFELAGLAGHLRLGARAPGFVPLEVDLGAPAPGAALIRDLVLTRAVGAVRGRVVDGRGFGIEGAEVVATGARATGPVRAATVTDPYGDFAMEGLDGGAFEVTIAHPDYAGVALAGVVAAPATGDLRIVLGGGGAIAGVVVEAASGLDVARFTVELRGGAGRPPERREFTGGAFRWAALRPGTYTVRIIAPPFAPVERLARIDPPPADPRAPPPGDVELTFTLSHAGGIAGEVREAPSGTPLPGIRIAAYLVVGPTAPGMRPGTAPVAVGRSGAGGAFRLDGLSPGDYLLLATDAEHEDALSAPIRVEAGETTDFVTLKTPMRAEGSGPVGPVPGTIRVRLGVVEGAHVVVAVTAGSSAAAAGLLPEDVLLAIDDAPLEGLPLAEAVRRLGGEAGTVAAVLVYRRSTDEQYDLRIARER